MKIGIDARLYGISHGGIGRYIENLISQLELLDQTNEYVIFLQKSNFDQYIPQNKNFTKVLANFKAYGISEQLFFPLLLRKYRLDLVHFTHFNVPIFYFSKFIVTIHDLIISHYPDSRATTLNPILYKLKLFLYKIVIRSAAQRSKGVIAVSEYTKNDIIKFLHVDSSKVSVTYEGVSLPEINNSACEIVLSDLGISGDYLLYVGSAYPHKNLDRLLIAFSGIDTDTKLVLVGSINYFYKQLQKTIEELDLSDSVVLTDRVSDKQLACLYKSAKLYIFPSLIEGFGLPPLEAQSYGLPVISSKATCLSEILGDSVKYIDPRDTENIKSVIDQAMNNEDLLQSLKTKGFENIKKYSWEKCARETKQIYEK